MKKRAFLWIIGIFLTCSTMFAQNIPQGVIEAFKKGNAGELNKYLNDNPDLVIKNQSKKADKQTATSLIADFFTDNKVTGFNVNHQGKRDETEFIIGTLSTQNGNFRVNCFFKRIKNKYLIHQIRIEKTNE